MPRATGPSRRPTTCGVPSRPDRPGTGWLVGVQLAGGRGANAGAKTATQVAGSNYHNVPDSFCRFGSDRKTIHALQSLAMEGTGGWSGLRDIRPSRADHARGSGADPCQFTAWRRARRLRSRRPTTSSCLSLASHLPRAPTLARLLNLKPMLFFFPGFFLTACLATLLSGDTVFFCAGFFLMDFFVRTFVAAFFFAG